MGFCKLLVMAFGVVTEMGLRLNFFKFCLERGCT